MCDKTKPGPAASTRSDVKPWTGARPSPSPGAARFLPATVVIGTGSWGLEAGAFAGSSVFERKTEGLCSFSDVYDQEAGPDIVRDQHREVDGTAKVEGNDLVYRTGTATRGC